MQLQHFCQCVKEIASCVIQWQIFAFWKSSWNFTKRRFCLKIDFTFKPITLVPCQWNGSLLLSLTIIPRKGTFVYVNKLSYPISCNSFNKLLFLVRWHASKDSATHHELKRNICSVAIRQSKGQRFIALLWIMSSTSGLKIHHLQKYICALEIFW